MLSSSYLRKISLLLSIGAVAICHAAPTQSSQSKDASEATLKANKAVLQSLPFHNQQDFEDCHRGFIAELPNQGIIKDINNDKVVWDLLAYEFIKEGKSAPDTVNPSLWRQSQLLTIAGLFKVTDGIYQVRNADISNITFIEGDTGVIVMDPLISTEVAKAALELYFEHRPKKPVVAVIYTHSHIDHFGGVKGVVSEEDVKAGKVRVIAPEGFMEEALSENVLTGNAMSRRATYMYGSMIPKEPKGQVSAGLGLTTSAGTVTLIAPTELITHTGQEVTVDGIKFVFQMVPDSEAPSEMHFYIPKYKAFCPAENATHTMHNLYTLRGAKVRDGLSWAKYLHEILDEWGDNTEVLFSPHHWPIWGNDNVVDHLKKQRDTYKYIHDQTLRLANHGYSMNEIAEMIQLPPSLEMTFGSRGYYGTLNHNAKAVYFRYLGWFDANPAHLHPLPPVEGSKKYVEFMGGPDAILAKAKQDYDKGEYRWVAEVVNHVIFADPENKAARELQANTLEQLGYQAESGPWRAFYLTGAKELREGVPKHLPPAITASPDTISAMPLDVLFDFMAVKLDGPKAVGKNIRINWDFTDTNEKYAMSLENSVLNYSKNKQGKNPDTTITLKRTDLNDVLLGKATLKDKIVSGAIQVTGQKDKITEILALQDKFEFWFNIVTP